MLGIWEYFWNVLDWGVAASAGSIKKVTATFCDTQNLEAQLSDTRKETGQF